MKKDEFAHKLAEILTRQEKLSKVGTTSVSNRTGHPYLLKEILGSNEFWDRFPWLKKEDEYEDT